MEEDKLIYELNKVYKKLIEIESKIRSLRIRKFERTQPPGVEKREDTVENRLELINSELEYIEFQFTAMKEENLRYGH